MKRFLILLILCTITLNIIACNDGIKLIASKKQTVVPCIKSAKPYTNYLFEIALVNKTVKVSVDSVVVHHTKGCVKVNHAISTNKLDGTMTLNASLEDGNYTTLKNCKGTSEKVLIHYKVNNRSGKLKVSSFEEETVTRR